MLAKTRRGKSFWDRILVLWKWGITWTFQDIERYTLIHRFFFSPHYLFSFLNPQLYSSISRYDSHWYQFFIGETSLPPPPCLTLASPPLVLAPYFGRFWTHRVLLTASGGGIKSWLISFFYLLSSKVEYGALIGAKFFYLTGGKFSWQVPLCSLMANIFPQINFKYSSIFCCSWARCTQMLIWLSWGKQQLQKDNSISFPEERKDRVFYGEVFVMVREGAGGEVGPLWEI